MIVTRRVVWDFDLRRVVAVELILLLRRVWLSDLHAFKKRWLFKVVIDELISDHLVVQVAVV